MFDVKLPKHDKMLANKGA